MLRARRKNIRTEKKRKRNTGGTPIVTNVQTEKDYEWANKAAQQRQKGKKVFEKIQDKWQHWNLFSFHQKPSFSSSSTEIKQKGGTETTDLKLTTEAAQLGI